MAKSTRPATGTTKPRAAAPTTAAVTPEPATEPVPSKALSAVPADAFVVGRPPLGLGRIPVTKVSPVVEGGAYPAKAVVGELFPVSARVFREGHDAVNATIVLTAPGRHRDHRRAWPRSSRPGLDIWQGWVRPDSEGDWTFRVEAWSDPWATWVHHAEAKLPIAQDVPLVCLEGQDVLTTRCRTGGCRRFRGRRGPPQRHRDDASPRARHRRAPRDRRPVGRPSRDGRPRTPRPRHPDRRVPAARRARAGAVQRLVRVLPALPGCPQGRRPLGLRHVRLLARAPRGGRERWASTSSTCRPIHPIGTAFRKGKNNSLTPSPHRPGLPLGDRQRGRRPRRDPPRPRRLRRVRPVRRQGQGAQPRGRPRLRAAGLPRPPVGHDAPRVVHHAGSTARSPTRRTRRRSTRTSTRSTSTTTRPASSPSRCGCCGSGRTRA